MSSSGAGRYGGDGHPLSPLAAGAAASVYDDPMARVLGLDSDTSGGTRWLGYGLAAIGLMFGFAVGANAIERTSSTSSGTTAQEIDVQAEVVPPPPPPPTAKPEDKPEVPRVAPHEAPPPPTPAQAAKVLTREPDPNEPVDLTGDTIVTGNADTFAGGTTASNGTSKTAVRDLAPVEKPPPPASVAPAVDLSRPARLAGGLTWNDCGFPPEADALQIDDASVTIEVDVKADGTQEAVRVLSDPGHGFGRLARSCALAKQFEPALGREGHPIASTKPIRIHFTR
jgi:protein TonB